MRDFVFLPLGGSDEIGMNLNLYGIDGKWLMVDFGISFSDHLGVEIVMPKIDFIEQHLDDLVGLVVTHAHEDHIGAIPYLWNRLKCPIYATPFTAEVIRNKLKETPFGKSVPLIEVKQSGHIDLHPFKVEFVNLTHSIPEPNALVIRTSKGTVVHTGDWKLDPHPLVGHATDIDRLKAIGDEGVLALVCDSTNVFSEGSAGSEKEVRDNLIDVVKRYPKHRAVVACFASNVARLETAAIAALETGRHVVMIGRSLEKMEMAARYAGYLKGIPKFLSAQQSLDLPKDKTLLVCTGSQGEHKSALARISMGTHPQVRLDAGDVVIFSARSIPGNEKHIGALQNRLTRQGALIVTASTEDIHVSGHPHRDELKQMYEWVRPKTIIPVHGEARHLFEQKKFALSCGVPHGVIPNNGNIIRLSPGLPEVIDETSVPHGYVVLDGSRIINQDSVILKQRGKIATQGVVVATIALNKNDMIKGDMHFTIIGISEPGEETEKFKTHMEKSLKEGITLAYKTDRALMDAMIQIIRRVANLRYGKKPTTEIHLIRS